MIQRLSDSLIPVGSSVEIQLSRLLNKHGVPIPLTETEVSSSGAHSDNDDNDDVNMQPERFAAYDSHNDSSFDEDDNNASEVCL